MVTGLLVAALTGACAGTQPADSVVRSTSRVPATPTRTAPPTADPAPDASGRPVQVVVAGDLACSTPEPTPDDCQQLATAEVAESLHPDAVLLVGDLQYEHARADEFARSFDPSWGRFKAITHPVAGNHEYDTDGAAPYFDYFGDAAGPRDRGWYSFELGAWHVVALNSNCSEVGGCGEGSAQLAWLRADLAQHPARCVMAYWHHPRWSNSSHGDNTKVAPFVQTLYDAGAELVFTGHDHNYQRFQPRNPSGELDDASGLREFVVGMGGRDRYKIRSEDGADAGTDDSFGVLSVTLRPEGYDWRYVPAAGGTDADQGSAACH